MARPRRLQGWDGGDRLSGSKKNKSTKGSAKSRAAPARERLLEAAYEVFVKNGFSGATTDMIQSASETSKATMYAHFVSKEVLFHEMLEHRLSKTMSGYKELSKNIDDIANLLSVIGNELLQAILEQESVDLCRLIIGECVRFPHLGPLFFIVGPKVITDLVEMRLSEAHRRKELFVPDPAEAAEHFIGMIKGDFHFRALLGYQTPSPQKLRQHVDKSVTAFLAAYAPERANAGQSQVELKTV
jgi:TetR/AcrR family transcriptional repressor of mexJK operon